MAWNAVWPRAVSHAQFFAARPSTLAGGALCCSVAECVFALAPALLSGKGYVSNMRLLDSGPISHIRGHVVCHDTM